MSFCCHSDYRPKLVISLPISLSLLFVFIILQKYISFSVSSTSSLLAFYLFGLVAGFSTCSPISTSLFLSFLPKRKNALIFILSRFFSFVIFGCLLGIIGSFFRLSFQNIAITSLLVSLITILLSLNFLKIISLKGINIKSSSPLLAGLLTFFLPCGFTLTVQSLAIISASPFVSSAILSFFCLGTITPLLIIFFTSKKIIQNPHFSAYFNQIIGLVLLFFSLYSLNASFSLLNLPSLSFPQKVIAESTTSTIKMTATSTGYTPNYFKVKVGQQIHWEITDMGSSGCTNAILAPSLFKGPLNLVPGTTSTIDFVAPTTPGKYRFSCWMGMISGIFEVIP